MNIGRPRRTIYIEPIEEPDDAPVEEPSPEMDPMPETAPKQEQAVR